MTHALLSRWLLAGALIPLATPALAQWEDLTQAKSGDLYRVDQASIRKSGDTARLWVLVNHPQPLAAPTRHSHTAAHSYRALMLFDCKAERVRWLEAAFFTQADAQGRLVASSDGEDWASVAPDTPEVELMKLACAD